MGNGILDYLDSAWPSILGLGGNQGQTALPPPVVGSNGGFSPGGAVDGNALTPSNGPDTGFFNAWGNVPAANAAAAAAPNAPAAPAVPSLTTPANAAPAPTASPSVPMPMPRPEAANGPGAPLNIVPPGGMGPGAPMSLAPPNPGGGAPPASSNLEQLLGAVRPAPSPMQNAIGTGIAALGKGLSTVSGNTGAGAFARGMGGALTGGSQYAQQQQTQNFNIASNYFKYMLAAKNMGNMEAYRQAQAAYLGARAQAITLGGGTGSGAYQNSPYWKTMKIEDSAQKYQNGQKQILLKQWSLNGTSP